MIAAIIHGIDLNKFVLITCNNTYRNLLLTLYKRGDAISLRNPILFITQQQVIFQRLKVQGFVPITCVLEP